MTNRKRDLQQNVYENVLSSHSMMALLITMTVSKKLDKR